MKRDTFELIQALEGNIEPCADSHIDSQHKANLKEWCDIHMRMTEAIADCAKSTLGCYASASEIIMYARLHLLDIVEYLGAVLDETDNVE